MATATPHQPGEIILVLDQLDMLVTNDPVAELDGALTAATASLCRAQQRHDSHAVERLTQWIDQRLDQRNDFSPRR